MASDWNVLATKGSQFFFLQKVSLILQVTTKMSSLPLCGGIHPDTWPPQFHTPAHAPFPEPPLGVRQLPVDQLRRAVPGAAGQPHGARGRILRRLPGMPSSPHPTPKAANELRALEFAIPMHGGNR